MCWYEFISKLGLFENSYHILVLLCFLLFHVFVHLRVINLHVRFFFYTHISFILFYLYVLSSGFSGLVEFLYLNNFFSLLFDLIVSLTVAVAAVSVENLSFMSWFRIRIIFIFILYFCIHSTAC